MRSLRLTRSPTRRQRATPSRATAIVDETPPTLSETSTPSNTEVLLTYNEPLDPDSIPGTSAFTVSANANEILSATLTVQDTGSGFLGCNNVTIGLPSGDRCSTTSTLTADAFSYNGTDYEVELIELKAGTLDLEVDQTLTAAAVADLTLNVGATSFAFADAIHSSGTTLRWTSTGLTWSENDQIALSIGGVTARTARPFPRQRSAEPRASCSRSARLSAPATR